MKLKELVSNIGAFVLFGGLFIIFLPFILLYFLFKLIITPYDYIKYKRSRYQQDFPYKYSWLRQPHVDNEIYTIIKDNGLPIEYIKWQEEYELPGSFLYRDALLVFFEPLFFDKKKGLWFLWMGGNADEAANPEDEGEEYDEDNTDDCVEAEDAKAVLMEELCNNGSGRKCNRVVFFYQRKRTEKLYGKNGLDAMRDLDGFILYEKGKLAEAIQKFIDTY